MNGMRALRRANGMRALRHRNFRLFWAGQLISLIGTWMQQIAQAWLVLTLTNDPLMLGLLAAGQYGPVLVFGLFGGIMADALPKRRILLTTQMVSMTLAFVLGILAVTGVVQVWHVILLASFLGLTTVVDLPTRHAFFIEMVGREDLPNAVALNSAVFNTARVVGPAIAGLTIALLGAPLAFLLNGASFIAVIGCMLAMRTSELMPAPRSRLPRTIGAVFENLAEGLRYLRGSKQLLTVVVVLGLVSTAALNFAVVIPPLARDILVAGPLGFGLLMTAAGMGSLTTALSFAFRRRPDTRTILGGALLLASLEVVLSFSRWLPLSLVCMYGMGMGSTAMAMGTQTVIQLTVPDHLRGRLSAVFTTILVGSTPIGGLIAGALATAVGTPFAIMLGGLLAAAVGVAGMIVAWRAGLLASGAASQGAAAALGAREEVTARGEREGLTALRVITFVRYPALEVGAALGSFDAAGLAVSVELTPSSLVQMQGLTAGPWDLAITSFDNLLVSATREGVPSVAFGVADRADLPFFVRPEIDGYDDLRGKPIAADAVDTAFALVLRRLLLAHGLDLARGDYSLVAVGANAQRLESLRRGETMAAILAPPWDAAAREAGLRQLGHHREVLPDYPGQMLAATAAWLGVETNRATAVRFLRAWRQAAAWSRDPANREAAVTLLTRRQGISPAAAAVLLDGVIEDIAVDPAGPASVLDVRLELGLMAPPGPTLADYYDASLDEEARR